MMCCRMKHGCGALGCLRSEALSRAWVGHMLVCAYLRFMAATAECSSWLRMSTGTLAAQCLTELVAHPEVQSLSPGLASAMLIICHAAANDS